MAAWDYYPYDTYCQKLAGDWLWALPGPAQNLANPGSTFNVKFDEAVYNAYRKGGFVFAEQFKDCVVARYGYNVTTHVAVGPHVSATEFAAAASLKLLAPVARAQADIASESAQQSALQASRRMMLQETGLQKGAMRVLYQRKIGAGTEPVTPLPKPVDEGLVPAGATLADLFVGKTWHGYPYRGVADGMDAYVLSELDQMDVSGDLVLNVGAQVQAKALGWHAGIGGGDADDWAAGQRAAGKGVLVGAGGAVDAIAQGAPPGFEAYAVATRDISVVSSLCQLDDTAMVIYEPNDGWLEPSAAEAAQGKEAGVGLPDWAVWGGIAVGTVGLVWLVRWGLRGG